MPQPRQRANSPALCLSVWLGPQRIRWCPPTWEGWVCLHRSLTLMLMSPGPILTDTSRNNVLPAICTSLPSFRLAHKSNHYCILLFSAFNFILFYLWSLLVPYFYLLVLMKQSYTTPSHKPTNKKVNKLSDPNILLNKSHDQFQVY